MKLHTTTMDPTQELSTRLSVGDFIPYAVIKTGERIFDVQGKAGESNIFIFLKETQGALAESALKLRLPYRHFVFSTAGTDLDHGRYFESHSFCALFTHDLAPMSAFITDSNLKIVDFVDAQTLEELSTELSQITVKPTNIPPPVLVIPHAIDEVLARDLIDYIDQYADDAVEANKDFKRRLHIHPNPEL